MAYSIRLPDGTLVDNIPDEVTPEAAKAKILQDRPDLMLAPGKSAPFSLADTGLAALQGLTGAAKGVASAFGADNAAAEALGKVQTRLGEAISPERRAEMQRRAALEKQAAESGSTMEELAAFLGGVKEAPVQAIAQGVGSSIPAVAAGLATVVAGAPAAIAGAVALGARALFGAIQGAGEVKGSIMDAVERGLVDQGVDPATARRQAVAAQEYLGKNTGTILAGSGLGAVAGGSGVENVLSKALTKQGTKEATEGIIKRGLKEAGKEALPEGAQGGQEQYAQNVALSREGVATPAMQGVLGSAVRDAAVGALTGAAVSPLGRGAPQPPAPPAAETPPPATPPAAAPLPDTYAGLVKERAALEQQEQTDEVKARIALLADAMKDMDIAQVEEARKAEEQAKAEEAKARRSAFAAEEPQQVAMRDVEAAPIPKTPEVDLFGNPVERPEPVVEEEPAKPDARELEAAGQARLPLRRTPEGMPTTTPLAEEKRITAEDIMMTAIPLPKGVQRWVEQNVWNRTPTQLNELIKRNPQLVEGSNPRAKLLRVLTAPEVPKFEEAPRVQSAPAPRTENVAAQPPVEPGRSKPSVGVPGKPARARPAQPTGGAAAPAAEPAKPVGLGLVPTEQPAGEGRDTEKQEPGALTPPAGPRSSYDIQTDIRRLEDEQKTLLTKAGRIPAPRSKARARWDELGGQIDTLHNEWMQADLSERQAKAAEEEAAQEAKRKADEADMKRRLDEQAAEEKRKRQEAEIRRKEEAKPAEKPKAAAPLPERMREPIGVNEFGVEEGETEIARGPQGMLFPMTKKEEIAYGKQKDAEAAAAAMEEDDTVSETPEKDERQLELAPRAEEPGLSEGVREFLNRFAPATVVYNDGKMVMVKATSSRTGDAVYIPMRADGTYASNLFGPMNADALLKQTPKIFTADEHAEIQRIIDQVRAEDAAKAAQFPDGPFTGQKSNVVAGASVSQQYTDYLRELMRSMGLGDVRVFLYHGQDVRGKEDELHLHDGYYAAMSRSMPNKSQKGATRPFGPNNKDFMLFINDNMNEAETLEVISHELGHMIEQIAFDNAPKDVQNAIKDEYDDWLDSLKGKTFRDLLNSLRNRNMAAQAEIEMKANLDTPIDQMSARDKGYWLKFDEWFADNVSRWATTADKPLSVTEKFFAKIAQMMRDLVAIVTGRKYPPNTKVAEFLNSMGPGAADAWLAVNKAAATNVKPARTNIQNAANPLLIQQSQSLIPTKGTIATTLQSAGKAVANKTPGISRALKVRTSTVDKLATVEHRLMGTFDKGIRDAMGNVTPIMIARQAQDIDKFMQAFYEQGGFRVDQKTKLLEVYKRKDAPDDIFPVVQRLADKLGMDFETAFAYASTVVEGMRLSEIVKTNATGATDFAIHWRTPNNAVDMQKINAAVTAYNGDPDFKELSRIMDDVRIEMVNQLEATGRLTPETAKVWRDVSHYVPFDRIEDFSKAFSSNKKITTRGLASLGKLPELKGSELRPVGNVFENYFKTLGWMASQLAKQNANTQMMAAMQAAGFAAPIAAPAVSRTGHVVPVYEAGEQKYYDVRSEWDQVAFLDKNGPAPGYVQFLSKFTGVVRTAVTANPVFAAKQVVMDIQGALLFSGVKNPYAFIVNSLRNFGQLSWNETMNVYRALRGEATITHDIETRMRKLGLSGAVDYTKSNPAMEELFRQGVRKRTKFGSTTLGAIIHGLEQITHASDLAVRSALYDDTIRATQDQVLASYKARELINFRRQGSAQWAQHLVSMVPFLNASAQANDLIYRTLTGKSDASGLPKQAARAQFMKNAAIYAGFALTYAMMRSGDDDYEKMDRRTRDNNWILPNNAAIPIRGDLAILKVAIENGIDWNRRQHTPDELDAVEAIKTVTQYAWDQTLGRVVTPVPVALRPWLENLTNFSFLTQRAMEGTYQQSKPAHLREIASTTETSKAIAEIAYHLTNGKVSISPNHIDNVLRGYLGTTAATVTMITDAMIYPDKVDRPLHKMVAVGAFAWDETQLTQNKTEFYDLREKVIPVLAAFNDMKKNDPAKAVEYARENESALLAASTVQHTLNELSKLRQYEKWLKGKQAAEELPKEEREAALLEMGRHASELTQYVRALRHELKI